MPFGLRQLCASAQPSAYIITTHSALLTSSPIPNSLTQPTQTTTQHASHRHHRSSRRCLPPQRDSRLRQGRQTAVAVRSRPRYVPASHFKPHASLTFRLAAALEAINQDNQLSFYRLGGIHGFPYQPWGETSGVTKPTNGWQGYCTHGTVAFPTWHRPYVAAVEVRIIICTIFSPPRSTLTRTHIAIRLRPRCQGRQGVHGPGRRAVGRRCEASPHAVLGLGRDCDATSTGY